jgi:hypothetical protein
MAGVPIRIVFRGLQYKKYKQKVERVVRGSYDANKIRHVFLNRRNIRTGQRIRLEN